MLIKIADSTFSIAFSLNLLIMFDFSWVIYWTESAIYSTYQKFDLSGVFLYIQHTKLKGNWKIFEIVELHLTCSRIIEAQLHLL